MSALSAIPRPGGGVYRPRKVVAHLLGDEDEIPVGVFVAGTTDLTRAKVLADELVSMELDSGYVAVDPIVMWWRNTFSCGRRTWVTDQVRGQAGVWFREIVERTA